MVEPVATPRAEVRVPYGVGADIAVARSVRLRVGTDGELVVAGPGEERVAAPPGGVQEMVWLDGRATTRILGSPVSRFLTRRNPVLRRLSVDGVPLQHVSGLCVALGAAGPVAAWLVDETAPGSGDPSTKRRQSGSVALARALGLTLEAAPDDERLDPAAVRRVLVRSSTTSARTVLVVSVAVVVALLLSARSVGGFDGDVVWPYALGALVLALPVALAALRARRRTLDLVSHPPEPSSRQVHRPAASSDATTTQVQLGREDVVVVPGDGSETWFAGPAVAGGVSVVQVVADRLVLVDARDEQLAMLPSGLFAPDDASVASLARAAEAAGVRVDVVAAPTGRREPPGDWFATGPTLQSGDLSPLQPWVMWLVAPLLLLGGLATVEDAPAVGYVVVAGAVVVLACRVWCWWTWRSWTAALRRRGVA